MTTGPGPGDGPGTNPGDDHSLPDLKQPPAQITTSGGGPWLSDGPSVDDDTKSAYDNVSDDLNYMAAGWAAGTAIAAFSGVEPAAVLMGLGSAGCWFGSQVFSDLAEDPPQPYQEIVTFDRRVIAPPGLDDPTPGIAPCAIAVQYTLAGVVTAQGSLTAAERLGAATQAGDYDWQVTHLGVLEQATATIPVDLAYIAAAHRAAGLAIQGTPLDAQLTPGPAGTSQWIASQATQAAMARNLHDVGVTQAQSTDVLAWWRSNPPYGGRPMLLSRLLVLSADRLYRAAQALSARA